MSPHYPKASKVANPAISSIAGEVPSFIARPPLFYWNQQRISPYPGLSWSCDLDWNDEIHSHLIVYQVGSAGGSSWGYAFRRESHAMTRGCLCDSRIIADSFGMTFAGPESAKQAVEEKYLEWREKKC